MALTQQQLQTLKTNILAQGSLATAVATRDGDAIAAFYNVVSATDVWNTATPVDDVFDAIDWSKYTPTDAADGTAVYTNRLLLIQTKQINLQAFLFPRSNFGRPTLNFAKQRIREGLRDAVIALPAGTGGASVTAGGVSGVNVLTAGLRKATVGEALLLANASVQTGTVTAGLLGFEGQISPGDALNALDLP